MAEPTQPLLQLIFLALDHAVHSIENSNGPLVPFAVIDTANGERMLARFTSGQNPEEARQHARAHIAQSNKWIRYAVTADGTITEGGRRVPVVMVEAGEQGAEHGFMFVQRFESTPSCKFLKLTQNPSLIDEPPLLRPLGR